MADRWGIDWNTITRLNRIDIRGVTETAHALSTVNLSQLSDAAKFAESADFAATRRAVEDANRQLAAAASLDARRLFEATRVDWAAIAHAADLTARTAILDRHKELMSALAVQPIPRLVDREMLTEAFRPALAAAQELARQSLADKTELQTVLKQFAAITADIDLTTRDLDVQIEWSDDGHESLDDRAPLLDLVPADLRTGSVKVDLLIGGYIYLGVVVYLVVGVQGVIGQVLFTGLGKLWEAIQIALADEKAQTD